MKFLLSLALLLATPALAQESGPANSVMRVPSGGGKARMGQVDISSSAAVTGALPIANGGTASTTAANAINALLPAQGSATGQFLTTNGTAASWGAVLNSVHDIQNLGITATVAGNALTVNFTQASGSALSTGSSAAKIAFRPTSGLGTYSMISQTSAPTNLVVPNTATLGCTSVAAECYIYVYALNPAGTGFEPAVSTKLFEENSTITTTAIDTTADTWGIMYSTTARTAITYRLVGRLRYGTSPNGVYGSVPSSIDIGPQALVLPVRLQSTYTPTLTPDAQYSATTAYAIRYVHDGKTVVVYGKIAADAVTSGNTGTIGITLPLASDLTATDDLYGFCNGNESITRCVVEADATNNRAALAARANYTSNEQIFFTFMYTLK